jgi:hypoxanthine phosphoribosyltransferase
VLLIEDIVDTGLTLKYLQDLLYARTPAGLTTCALLSKPSRRKIDVKVDFLGFEVPDEFVVGYGLDAGQLYRNLPYIGVFKL